MTNSKAQLGHEKLRNLCQLEVVWIRFHKFPGNLGSYFFFFFSIFILFSFLCFVVVVIVVVFFFFLPPPSALIVDVLVFLAVFPRKYSGWGGGEGLGILDLLLSVRNPFYKAQAGHICTPFVQHLSHVLSTVCALTRHIAFPQTAHRRTPIHLCLATTEDKHELQLLSAPYMLQVTKWWIPFIFLTFWFSIHLPRERSLVAHWAEDARILFWQLSSHFRCSHIFIVAASSCRYQAPLAPKSVLPCVSKAAWGAAWGTPAP